MMLCLCILYGTHKQSLYAQAPLQDAMSWLTLRISQPIKKTISGNYV